MNTPDEKFGAAPPNGDSDNNFYADTPEDGEDTDSRGTLDLGESLEYDEQYEDLYNIGDADDMDAASDLEDTEENPEDDELDALKKLIGKKTAVGTPMRNNLAIPGAVGQHALIDGQASSQPLSVAQFNADMDTPGNTMPALFKSDEEAQIAGEVGSSSQQESDTTEETSEQRKRNSRTDTEKISMLDIMTDAAARRMAQSDQSSSDLPDKPDMGKIIHAIDRALAEQMLPPTHEEIHRDTKRMADIIMPRDVYRGSLGALSPPEADRPINHDGPSRDVK